MRQGTAPPFRAVWGTVRAATGTHSGKRGEEPASDVPVPPTTRPQHSAWPPGNVPSVTPPDTGSPGALPVSLRAAVRYELRAALRPPFTTPLIVVFNGALMAASWILLPERWKNWLFTLHGPWAFAMVLAGWMYADVPTTNVLAPDRERVLVALDRPAELRRLLYAKNITLWCFVAPLCTCVAVVIGLRQHQWTPTVLTITAIAVVPFGTLGIASWTGIIWPYHPRGLRFRWEHRHQWIHMIVRWIALLLIPYALVPVLAMLIITPSLVVWSVLTATGLTHHLPTSHFAGGVVLAAAVSISAFYGGHRIGEGITRRRHDDLTNYLQNPDRG